jgi:hypothetical protein
VKGGEHFMGFSIKLSSLDDVKKKLESIRNKIDELNSKEIQYFELFSSSFMHSHSNFSSFSELLEAGGFIVNTEEDFSKISGHKFDTHISKTTDFDDWEDMRRCAIDQYIKQNLL